MYPWKQHKYGRENKERRRDASHITPTKSLQKKVKLDYSDISSAALLHAINSLMAKLDSQDKSLTVRFDSQDRKLEDIADKIRQNSITIATSSKLVECKAAEIKEYKSKHVILEK